MNQTRKDHTGVAAAIRKQPNGEPLLDCPLCERPHSQFATIVELARGHRWQVLHQCPDRRAQSVEGETREKAVEAWNFYCDSQRRR
jgi:hypothetical protein